MLFFLLSRSISNFKTDPVRSMEDVDSELALLPT